VKKMQDSVAFSEFLTLSRQRVGEHGIFRQAGKIWCINVTSFKNP